MSASLYREAVFWTVTAPEVVPRGDKENTRRLKSRRDLERLTLD